MQGGELQTISICGRNGAWDDGDDDSGGGPRDERGAGYLESQTTSAAIMREMAAAPPSGGAAPVMRPDLKKRQTFRSPLYVAMDTRHDRQGQRLAAEYVCWVDTYTAENMAYLLTKADECSAAAARHDTAQLAFKAKHTRLVIPNFICSTAAATTAAVGSAGERQEFSMMSVAFAAMATFLNGVIAYHEWNLRSSKHGTASVRFRSLADHIRGIEQLHEERRRPYEVELTYLQMALGGIFNEEPALPALEAVPKWYDRFRCLW